MRKVERTICYADGCTSISVHLGLCSKHYQRMRKYGSPDARPHYLQWVPDLERFDFYATDSNERGCRIWTGERETKMGYGRLYVTEVPGRRRVAAHRWAYKHFVGPIPDGMLVLHKCDNPPCVNPEHLFIGTYADNNHDCAAKGRKNYRRKLTMEIAEQIRARHREIGSQRKVAAEFGLGRTTVAQVVRGERWLPQ